MTLLGPLPPYPSETHLAGYCRPGEGAETCRYLVADADGFRCAKHKLELRTLLDRRVEADSITARGDNCPGFSFDVILPPARRP